MENTSVKRALNVCCFACIIYIGMFLSFPALVKGEDIQIPMLLPEDGRGTGKPVILKLKGKTYSRNGWFDQMVGAGRADPSEQFVISVLRKYKKGSLTDIRNLWMPDEQAKIVGYLTSAEHLAERQEYFRRMTRSRFLGKVHYGSYIIFVVQNEIEGYDPNVTNFTIKKIKNRFYLTNQLANDPVLSNVAVKFTKNLHPGIKNNSR